MLINILCLIGGWVVGYIMYALIYYYQDEIQKWIKKKLGE